MSKNIKWLLGLSGIVVFSLALLGFTTLTASSQGYKIVPLVFDNGGGKATSPNYSTRVSIGQGVISLSASDNYKQWAGYIYTSENANSHNKWY